MEATTLLWIFLGVWGGLLLLYVIYKICGGRIVDCFSCECCSGPCADCWGNGGQISAYDRELSWHPNYQHHSIFDTRCTYCFRCTQVPVCSRGDCTRRRRWSPGCKVGEPTADRDREQLRRRRRKQQQRRGGCRRRVSKRFEAQESVPFQQWSRSRYRRVR